MARQGRWAFRLTLLGAIGGGVVTAVLLRTQLELALARGQVSDFILLVVVLVPGLVYLGARAHGWFGRRIGSRLDRVVDSDRDVAE